MLEVGNPAGRGSAAPAMQGGPPCPPFPSPPEPSSTCFLLRCLVMSVHCPVSAKVMFANLY